MRQPFYDHIADFYRCVECDREYVHVDEAENCAADDIALADWDAHNAHVQEV